MLLQQDYSDHVRSLDPREARAGICKPPRETHTGIRKTARSSICWKMERSKTEIQNLLDRSRVERGATSAPILLKRRCYESGKDSN